MRQSVIMIWFVAMPWLIGNSQNIADLKKDMAGIASDATEGRFTASEGYLKAAQYVSAELKAAGIVPGWTDGQKKTYLQPVPFAWDNYAGSALYIHGKAFEHAPGNFLITQPGKPGTGKWVVLAPGDSVKGKPAGIVRLPNTAQSKDWETTVIRQYRFGYMHYLPDGKDTVTAMPVILVSPALAELLSPGDSVIVGLRHMLEDKVGYNVVGFYPGAEPKFSNEAIIIGAHLDHIGRFNNDIYNGANDDASGCVAELGVARMLAAHAIQHPVLFVFFCGEELNLKGSGWFVNHLPIPKENISLAVNLEQLGSKHRSFKGVWALGDSIFKQPFYSAGRNFMLKDLQFSATDSVKDILGNTDTYSFMNRQIPSLLLGSGGFDEHHTPQDKIDLIDFEHLQKVTYLLYNLVRFFSASLNKPLTI
ncbi:MAG TPA: M28 family peptidase [Chitinophagaceae bacterium]|nr:M28 family peptidase [Chitinophagaceae bacterium]